MIWLWLASAAAFEVEGHVYGPDGEPVEGAYVVLYDHRLQYVYAVTNAAGSYRVVDVPPNPYRVRILAPPEQNLLETWLPGPQLTYCPTEVRDWTSDEDVLGFDVTLEAGAEMTGQLLDPRGEPVEGARVVARSLTDDSITQSRYGFSGADGRWSIVGLTAEEPDGTGLYTVEITREGLPQQWLPGVYDDAEAEPIVIPAGEALDLGVDVVLDGIAVGGIVYGPDGPASGGEVTAYSPSQVASSEIGLDGTWLVRGLPPGEALAWAMVEGLALTYFPDSDRPADRVPILEEGAVYTDMDVFAPRESALRGRIVGGTGDLSGVSLLAYNDNRTVGIGDNVLADGTFSVDRLHGGRYTLMVYAGNEGFVDDFVRDASGEPVVFEVPDEGPSEEFEITLPAGARISGVVTDLYTGAPVYGAYVVATSGDGGAAEAVETGPDGVYELTGLRGARWDLRVDYDAYCAVDPDWVDLYFDNVVDPAIAESVNLQPGDALVWDPELPPDDDHDMMDDVWEGQMGLDPTTADGDIDSDGDGYTNLEEYRLGTDPMSGRESGGCGCKGGSGALIPLLLLPLARRRRLRAR